EMARDQVGAEIEAKVHPKGCLTAELKGHDRSAPKPAHPSAVLGDGEGALRQEGGPSWVGSLSDGSAITPSVLPKLNPRLCSRARSAAVSARASFGGSTQSHLGGSHPPS